MLALDDHWIWDSWIADDGETYHLYFLQAPKSLGSPDQRHTRARVGHATSRDLVEWEYHGEVLGPSKQGNWDDLAIWTGSVVRGDDRRWRMFYTAVSTAGQADGIFDQRIGVVVSDDLHSFHRISDRPLLEVDDRWYRTVDGGNTVSETWRDPWVFRDPSGNGWHMLLCARAKDVDHFEAGVIAHATSVDLETWTVRPPIGGPGSGFSQFEVPSVAVIDGTPVMVFSCHPSEQNAWRRNKSGRACLWTLAGPDLLGPWDMRAAAPFRAEPDLFAAPLVQQRDGTWCFLGFRNQETEGIWSFEILDPVPVVLRDDELIAHPRYSPAANP